jgi:hypothetical protein
MSKAVMPDDEEEQEDEVLSLSTSDGVPEQPEDAYYEEEEQSARQVRLICFKIAWRFTLGINVQLWELGLTAVLPVAAAAAGVHC